MNSPLTISAFAIGVTQLFKDVGIEGQWLKLVCVLAGAFATYMTIYLPDVWAQLSLVLASAAGTGWISLADDLLQKGAKYLQGQRAA